MSKTGTVFLADDDDNIRNIVSHVLESQGFEVVTTDNADDVMSIIKEEKPDAAILDVMMPGEKNGFELCYEIKNHPKLANLPVLMLTATTQGTIEDDEHWQEKSRADDFITKPFQSADLVDRVEDLVEQAWKEKEGPRFEV